MVPLALNSRYIIESPEAFKIFPFLDPIPDHLGQHL